ncbi:organic cation/carnitine transporter 3-like [Coffea eugenioides]|uniref:Organic cation/carnitine transporter 3-like n=1 Tax=Coffea arabica TaxID=13443 RepID=A0ABM4VCL4_COFAR|nr:organic cation/carnitine transporter 3-like [Coffea eugenioides]
MADSPPLLSNSAPSSDLANNGFRWSQVLQVILISMTSFFEAQQTFITIFTDAKPSWHCTQTADAICNSQSNICQLPPGSWQWDKPASTSIISEWSLQCTSSQVVAGLPSSSFFVGSLLGGLILSFHRDSLGQKKLLVLSCLTMSIASVSIAFSRNIWDSSVLRMLSGFGHAAIGSCVLVLSTESNGDTILCVRASKMATTTRQKVDSDRSLMGTLLKDRYNFQQLTLAMLVGFGIGVIYYGMPVGVGNLDFDLYLSIAFNAMLEIPSAVMIYLVKCRHRSLLLALATISCACGITSIMVGRGLQIGLEVTSFFSSCVVFNLLLIYTVEQLSISTRLSTLSKETSMSGTLSVTLDEQQQEQEKEHDGSNLCIQV